MVVEHHRVGLQRKQEESQVSRFRPRPEGEGEKDQCEGNREADKYRKQHRSQHQEADGLARIVEYTRCAEAIIPPVAKRHEVVEEY